MLSQSCDGADTDFCQNSKLARFGFDTELCKNLNILINNGYGNGLCSLQYCNYLLQNNELSCYI